MMNKILRYITAFLLLSLVFILNGYAFDIGQQLTEAEASNKGTGRIIERPRIEYKARGLRNPFQQPISSTEDKPEKTEEPIVAEPVSLPVLNVQGVIWQGNPKQAIINNKVMKVGDSLDNIDVIDISKEGVTVLYAGVQHHISTSPATGQQDSE
ncbi:MAG: hypothetical protein PHS12_04705 [Candidatus Omnitrophica bacterium]|jgi:hypothetical protein|nr:hypothetical protein [Candidatus Omnitrophota bacterium]